MRRTVALLASLLLAAASGRAGSPQAADELAARWVAATGGAAAWAAVQTLHVKSRSEYYSFDLVASAPDRVRIDAWSDASPDTDVRAFDGLSGWRINSMEGNSTPRSLSAAEIEELRTDREWMMELAAYKIRGYRLEPAGTEPVNGQRAHRLKLTRPDGSIVFTFLDEKTALEVRRIRPSRSPDGHVVDIVLDVGEYRRVGALLLPHRVGPATREYQINAPVDAAVFRRPGRSEAELARTRRADVAAELLPLGTPAPQWALTDASGRIHRSTDYRGRVVVLDFWAVWCAPCHTMMPAFQALHEELSSRGVAVLGISTWERGGNPARLMTERGYSYPALVNGETIADVFRVTGLPTVYVIGIDGRIIDAAAGADPAADARRRRIIDDELRAHGRRPDAKETAAIHAR